MKRNVPDDKQKVPVVFLKDVYLSGQDEIESGLSELIEAGSIGRGGKAQARYGYRSVQRDLLVVDLSGGEKQKLLFARAPY